MAGEFLRAHGIEIDAEMARIQNQPQIIDGMPAPAFSAASRPSTLIRNVSLPQRPSGSGWDVVMANGRVASVTQHDAAQAPTEPGTRIIDGNGALLAPSLCHPHVHIDKAYLLSHPKYSTLRIETGDFKEAMDLTGRAKAQFEAEDLLERGRRVIDESSEAGVTHMRAFVEVDVGVGTKCLEAGIKLKRESERRGGCHVQLCAFAQLPLFSDASSAGQEDNDGVRVRGLMEMAAAKQEVDAIGSTPYVEKGVEKMKQNIDWMIELSLKHSKHLDFHLDYHLDADRQPMVWHVIQRLKDHQWKERSPGKTVALGHCTRLVHFSGEQWRTLWKEIDDLPVSFVGLPTSDMFMMRTSERRRGTLNVAELIKKYGLNACVGINNIGNAFTPQGSCDALTLAFSGVGIYQAGTERDAEMLYECVSTRAKKAIGLGERDELAVLEGDGADLVLYAAERQGWRTRRSVAEAVYLYDGGAGRRAFLAGVQTSSQ